MKKLLLFVLACLLLVGCGSSSNYDEEMIKGKSFSMSDGSYIIFKEDNTFKWYRSKDVLDDYYYEGTYTVYRGENAINYIAKDLEDFGVTEKEQRDLLERNPDIKIDMYFNINLHNEKVIMDKEETKMDSDVHYYGQSNETYDSFNLVNMNTANYAYLTLEK